jgi:NTP pyrophosphatase (non-canonical NTP hydrolase)
MMPGVEMEVAMKPEWQDRAWDIHQRYIKQAQKKDELATEIEQVRFLTLAICGEAGELANLIKKSWRGDAIDLEKVRHEIADIRIYLNQLATHLGFDIDDACKEKLHIVGERIAAKEAEAA